MKPGEYIGSDGRAHNVRSVTLDELNDACNSATVQLNGGAWLTYKKHLLPSHPDFALAVAALQSLIRPSLDPRSGRVLAMREEGPLEWGLNGSRYRFANGKVEWWNPVDAGWHGPLSEIRDAFEAGRRYERERG